MPAPLTVYPPGGVGQSFTRTRAAETIGPVPHRRTHLGAARWAVQRDGDPAAIAEPVGLVLVTAQHHDHRKASDRGYRPASSHLARKSLTTAAVPFGSSSIGR